MERRIKILVEIEEWVGVGIVYSINNGTWMSKEKFFTELKKMESGLYRIIK